MLTPCLGRSALQSQLASALAAERWVTIVGPPGCGKTLLARHAVAGHEPTAWVNTRGLDRDEAVLDACLDALGAESAPGESRDGALGRALDGTTTVLVLDDLEVDPQLLGPTLQRLVDATSASKLVLTSLTMAGQPAERVVRVGAMPVPGPDAPLSGPVVELLLSRVERAGGHEVDLERHQQEIRRLLHATGGLPLLVEQVAVQIALVGLANVVPAPSMSATVRASYDLLDEIQQRCFRRMAQLSTPVSVEVLAEIAEVPHAQATSVAGGLVRRSLLEVLPDGRFDMLTPIRQEGRALAAPGEDAALVQQALMRWADRVVPDSFDFGAADARWLADVPALRATVQAACADPATRAFGYGLANRAFSSLYTAMRARDALVILESALESGDGPPAIGAQVARRAGIAASEVRGTYQGLWLLDRADEHARDAPDPAAQLARSASIRAEMHLDAGDLVKAEREARLAIEHDGPDGYIVRQALRTIADVYVSRAMFPEAAHTADSIMAGSEANDEQWITLSARTLLARIAVEQGRPAEAVAVCRAVVQEGRRLGEDRVALLAETLLRYLDPDYAAPAVDRDSLPWAVRLPVLTQDARGLFDTGDLDGAAVLAADLVALADGSRLGRDAVETRLLLGRVLLARQDVDQAANTFLAALARALEMPMPLRAADALEGLGDVARSLGWDREARQLSAASAAIRAPRHAVRWGYAATTVVPASGQPPEGWMADGMLTDAGRNAVAALFADPVPAGESPLDVLTAAEREVADRVADGLTSRRIAAELFVSPRTVDAHLTHIYRKLGISSRAKLAAIVVDQRR